MTNEERFWLKVNKNGPIPAHRPELGPCHLWTACGDHAGYGCFRYDGSTHHAHRVAFFLAHGRWPDPCALHHCDNRKCVNDAHLFEGTRADNMSDMIEKGRQRHARGELHSRAKLSEQDVRDIQANYLLCRVSQRELAQRFGVTNGQVCRIVRGKSWRAA